MSSPTKAPTNKREVLEDLAASEARFVRGVRATVNAFLVPLRDSRVLAASELATIFRTLEDIKNVHGKLQGVLQTAADDDNVANGMAVVANELLAARSALLEIYGVYAKGHESAVRALRGASGRADVARALEGISAGDDRVKGSSLEELLALPLQRLGALREILGTLLALSSPADRGFAEVGDTVSLLTQLIWDAANGGFHLSAAPAAAQGGVPAPALRSPPPIPAGGGGGARTMPSFSPSSAALVADSGHFGMGGQGQERAQGASTASVVLAAMPVPGGTLSQDLARGAVTTERVLAAQAQADEAVRKLEELEREVGLKEGELALAQREVARLEAENSQRGGGGGGARSQESAAAAAFPPMDEALRRLQQEEAELVARMRGSEHRAVFEAFLQRKKELEAEEASLGAKLAEHEEALAQVRNRLANPPASVLPSDLAKASLYVAWKRALAEREDLLRHARARKHELLKDLKARHETQVVLLELERRSAVDGLKEAVAAERAKVEDYKRDLASLDKSIEGARAAMKSFRQEFEALRVQLLIDRMAKSTQVANLADRRHRLAKEAEAFKEAVEAARQRVAQDESAKWEARLAEEKEAGEKRVADERRAVDAKIDKVRQALAERYEAGFRPLLKQAEDRHVGELQKVVDLQRELEAKEGELRAAHEQARALSAAVTTVAGGQPGPGGEAGGEGGSGGDGKYRDPTTGEVVPTWKLREFEDLKGAVCSMWEQLDVPPEEITAFLSEADLIAPFSPQVLDLYQEMYRRLTQAEQLPLPAPHSAAPPSRSPYAAHGGGGYEQQQQHQHQQHAAPYSAQSQQAPYYGAGQFQQRAVSPPAAPYSADRGGASSARFSLSAAPPASGGAARASAQAQAQALAQAQAQSAARASAARTPGAGAGGTVPQARKTDIASSAQRMRDEQDRSIEQYRARMAARPGARAASPSGRR